MDFEHGEDVRQILADERLDYRTVKGVAHGVPLPDSTETCDRQFSILSFGDGAVRSDVFIPPSFLDWFQARQQSAETDSSGADALPVKHAPERTPSEESGFIFLKVLEEMLREWRPDVLLTYGGYWLAWPVVEAARQKGIPVAFWVHNFAYRDAQFFRVVDRTLVPSACSAEHYRTRWGSRACRSRRRSIGSGFSVNVHATSATSRSSTRTRTREFSCLRGSPSNSTRSAPTSRF